MTTTHKFPSLDAVLDGVDLVGGRGQEEGGGAARALGHLQALGARAHEPRRPSLKLTTVYKIKGKE